MFESSMIQEEPPTSLTIDLVEIFELCLAIGRQLPVVALPLPVPSEHSSCWQDL